MGFEIGDLVRIETPDGRVHFGEVVLLANDDNHPGICCEHFEADRRQWIIEAEALRGKKLNADIPEMRPGASHLEG